MRLSYLISNDYARATGGWVYNERLLRELAVLGWRIDRVELPGGFPDPSDDALRDALTLVHALPDDTLVLGDQVCLSPLWSWMFSEAARHRFAIIVHHPQILEGSRPVEDAARLDADERRAIDCSDCVIATSPLTGRQLVEGYGATADRLVVAEPGTDLFSASVRSTDGPVNILSIGSIIPRKRHELIVAALAGLTDLDWRLTIAGNLDRAPEHVASLRAQIASARLDERVTLAGECTAAGLEPLWAAADVFAAAASHEGFGMAIAEAVARQVPVVTTRSGAVAGWLDPGAGVIVPTDDAEAYRAALRPIIADPTLREAIRGGARAARANLPTWPQTAAKVDAALRGLL